MIDAIQRTSTDKAPGPVQIPNRSWKNVAAKPLAKSVHRCLEISYCPKHFWDSITLASTIRKERSPDYHWVGAYRPIALLNTISYCTRENHCRQTSQYAGNTKNATRVSDGLPRRCNSWRIKYRQSGKRKVATMLSPDIAGTYDHVSYQRLLHIMKKKSCPEWISSYLTGRTTKLNLGGWTSESRATPAGIPQGSALSPTLYLIFDSELVEICYEESKLRGLRWRYKYIGLWR